MPDPSPHPWDRRPGEGDAAYAAFTAYLKLGPGRSLDKLAQKLGGPQKGRKRAATGAHQRQSRKWAWVERAKAYDAHLARIEQQGREQAAAESGRKWADRLEKTRDAAYGGAMAIVHECLLAIQAVKGTTTRDLKKLDELHSLLRAAQFTARQSCTMTPLEKGESAGSDEAPRELNEGEGPAVTEALRRKRGVADPDPAHL